MNEFDEMPHSLPEGYPSYFASADYFLGIARRALASEHDVQVTLPDIGEVILSPGRGAYHASVSDMQAFCQANASRFRITQLKEGRPDTQLTRPLTELLWQAAFHASRGRLVESYANGEPVRILDVIKFRRWPNLTRLPKTANTMRICALLTRRPSSLALVSRMLGIEREEAFQVYSAACGAGIAHVAGAHEAAAAHPAGIDLHGAHHTHHGLLNSLLDKIGRL